MRLIDADKLRETMYHEAFETDTDMQKWESGCWIRYKMFENAIENAPTIEAEPIRHGEWAVDTIYPSGVKKFHCSVCGQERTVHEKYEGVFRQNYCPNCGAKMDKGEADT